MDQAKVEVEIPKEDAHVLQYFRFEHLPTHLQVASKPFALMAQTMMETCKPSIERTECLRKLLEAKDCGVRAFLLKAVALALLLSALLTPNACAIDSLPELLKKAAKEEKKKAEKVKKGAAAVTFALSSGERIECVWLAKAGDVYRYQRTDGRLVSTPVKDVAYLVGPVLSAPPVAEVTVHAMYCNGGYCKPTVKTIILPAWPADAANR